MDEGKHLIQYFLLLPNSEGCWILWDNNKNFTWISIFFKETGQLNAWKTDWNADISSDPSKNTYR